MNQEIFTTMLEYHSWATSQLLERARHCTESALRQPLPVGHGSIMATFFHMVAAEELWLSRWRLEPWRPLPTDDTGMTVALLEARFQAVDRTRRAFLAQCPDWSLNITYRDTKQNEHTFPLHLLLYHVLNHATHHRAQLVNMLKQVGSPHQDIDVVYWLIKR